MRAFFAAEVMEEVNRIAIREVNPAGMIECGRHCWKQYLFETALPCFMFCSASTNFS